MYRWLNPSERRIDMNSSHSKTTRHLSRQSSKLVAALVPIVFHLSGTTYAQLYTESFQQWQTTTVDTWETKDLSGAPFNVPANAVVEIAAVNSNSVNEMWGGVRAAGSSLDRRFLLHEAEGNGLDIVVMHVQADGGSQIEHYSSHLSTIDFYLLGYWDSGTYVEGFQSFKAGADASWQNHDLTTYGVGSGQVAEIVLVNNNASNEREAGVRTDGSNLPRILDLHEAESGGDDLATIVVGTSGTGIIEVYAETDADVDFYLVGYWSTPPASYTELFSDIGSPGAAATWQDKDLSEFGVLVESVAEFALANTGTVEENQMGVRANGSSLGRLTDVHEAEDGGADYGRMHVAADDSSTIEFYHQDVSDAHQFLLVGYWASLFLYWQFDGCSGGTASDSSGVPLYDGTLQPDESTGPQRTKRGRICGALDFDGTNDAVSAGDLSEPDGAAALTVMAWAKPETLGNLRTVVSKFDSSTETGWTMETGDGASGGSDDVRIAFSATDYAYTTENILSTGTWGHWTMVFDGTATGNSNRLKFYFNGTQQSLTFAGTIPATAPNTSHHVKVGAASDGERYFDGVIDEVRMYDSVLSAANTLTFARQANYSVTDLGTLPAPDDDPSQAIAMNDNTQYGIAGFTEDTSYSEMAWYWENSTFTNLGTLGGTTSVARGINDGEQVVGRADDGTNTRAFIWDSIGGMVSLGTTAGHTDSEAFGINASGQVAGNAFDAGTPSLDLNAFLWTPDVPNGTTGTFEDLGTLGGTNSIAQDVNDSGQVVGGSQIAGDNYHPFRWVSSTFTDLGTLGGQSNKRFHRAQAINSAGKVVGLSFTSGGDQHAFLWVSGAVDGAPTNPEMKDLGTLGGTFGQALGINDSDEVVGWSTDAGENYYAFIWLNDTLIDLNDEIDITSSWVLEAASDINDDSRIVGWGANPSSDIRAFLLNPTRTCGCGGGIASAPLAAMGSGTTDGSGMFDGLAYDEGGNVVAAVLITGAQPGALIEFRVTGPAMDARGTPRSGLPTRVGFADGKALDRVLTVDTSAREGTFDSTISMVFANEELDKEGVQPTDVEVHILDSAHGPPPGTWVAAGNNIGDSAPTGVFGESGFVHNGDGTVDFWLKHNAGGTFAVGAKALQRDDDDVPRVAPPVCGLGMLPTMMVTFAGLVLTPRRRRMWRRN